LAGGPYTLHLIITRSLLDHYWIITRLLLDLSIQPRINIYIASDDYGSFIIDAPISYLFGEPYFNSTFNKQTNIIGPFVVLFIDVSIQESGLDLASGQNITANSTANEFLISLAALTPRSEPYNIPVTGSSSDDAHFYIASTQLYFSPIEQKEAALSKLTVSTAALWFKVGSPTQPNGHHCFRTHITYPGKKRLGI
jgi:hypothetical protein